MRRRRGIVAAWAVWAVGMLPAFAYQEAPELAARVAKGELPPVADRLPEHPAVVTPVASIGKYGGAWRRLTLGNRDIQLESRIGYDPLIRWDRSGKSVEPNLAERWEVEEDGRTFVFHLRKGLKWSDGFPLTSEDFLFYFEDVLGCPTLSPVFPSWLVIGGKPVQVTAPDAETVVFRFAEPYGTFLETMAFNGNSILAPKHYLKQFLPDYTNEAELERKTKEAGLDLWRALYFRMADIDGNPELPTWRAWKIAVPPPATRIVAERNPYYWKVDPAGNQLPYLDEVVYTDVQNNEIVTLKAMAGEVDFQARRIDATNYPLFMANRKQGQYRVMRDMDPNTVCLYVNQHSKDPELRPILQDRRFRIALSVAVNRAELIDLLYTGMATPSRGISSPFDPDYLPEFDTLYMAYDPAKANRLLDEVGLQRGANGMRRLPSGRPFRQILNVYPSESGTSTDLWQLVADYYREVGLDFTVKIDAVYLSVLQVCTGNSDFWAYLTGGTHWILDPLWYVPWQSASYFAPAYGRYQASGGKDKLGVKPPPDIQRLIDWYLELRSVVDDPARQIELSRRILRQWAEETYVIGICRTELITIVSNRFKNVPDTIIHDWRVMTPGYIGNEQYYIDDEK